MVDVINKTKDSNEIIDKLCRVKPNEILLKA